MTDQDALPTVTATFPLIRWILTREAIDIVHAHQATSVMGNESMVYAAVLGLPSVYTDHSLFQLDDLAGVILNRVRTTSFVTHIFFSGRRFSDILIFQTCIFLWLLFVSLLLLRALQGITNNAEYGRCCHLCFTCMS